MTPRSLRPARLPAIAALLSGALLGGAGPLPAQGTEQGERAAQLTDRFAERVSQALHLDANRSDRLRAELQKSREMRQELAAQRRTLFRELAALARSDQVDQRRVDELLNGILRTQVREAEINVDEQRRLSDFMAPLERARLLWMRQRFLQEARRQGQNPQRDNQIRAGDRRPPPATEQRTVPDPRPPRR